MDDTVQIAGFVFTFNEFDSHILTRNIFDPPFSALEVFPRPQHDLFPGWVVATIGNNHVANHEGRLDLLPLHFGFDF